MLWFVDIVIYSSNFEGFLYHYAHEAMVQSVHEGKQFAGFCSWISCVVALSLVTGFRGTKQQTNSNLRIFISIPKNILNNQLKFESSPLDGADISTTIFTSMSLPLSDV